MKVMVETSARHVHLSRGDLDILFGKGYQLSNKRIFPSRDSSPVKRESLCYRPQGEMKGVSILGPTRPCFSG